MIIIIDIAAKVTMNQVCL